MNFALKEEQKMIVDTPSRLDRDEPNPRENEATYHGAVHRLEARFDRFADTDAQCPGRSERIEDKPTSGATIDRSLLIDGLGKGLRIIESFSDRHARLTATEAGRLAGLTRTAARRYLLSLVHFGYVETDGKHYWLLPSILRLGRSYLDAAQLPRLVKPFLHHLSLQTGENANLGILDGPEVVYLTRSNSPRMISIGYHPGARMPAHVVASGFVILSQFKRTELDQWMAGRHLPRFSPRTITDPEAIRDSVALAGRLGYWIADQYSDVGLSGLAVPLINRMGQCSGAISMTFQTQLYPGEAIVKRLLPPLQDTAQALRDII